MNDRSIITVDVGTSSLRAALFDEGGGILRIEQRDNPPSYLDGGRVEQDPGSWRGLLIETIAACAEAAAGKGLAVAALSLTAQRSSVIPVDGEGRALHPAIMWQDTRTEGICARMEADQALVFRKSGLRIYPVFSAVKMRWLREELPEVWRASRKMLGIQDYLVHALTGQFVTDRSLASRTNLFSLETLDWDEELLGLFGVDRSMLCSLVDQGGIAGRLLPAMASATGLPAGLPVVSAGGDQQCAALGLGLVGPGKLVANTGTGSYLVAGVDRPVVDPSMSIACNVAAVPGSFILEAGSPTAGSAFRWLNREAFRGSSKGENDFGPIAAEAEASPPGANGVVLLPHFKGRGAPSWDPGVKASFLNLTLSTTRGDLARAVLEGIAAEFEENLEAIEALRAGDGSASSAAAGEAVRISGGMTASRLYNQILADCWGRPVERSDDTEATAIGAWISCAVTLGLCSDYPAAYAAAAAGRPTETYLPDPAAHAVYVRAASARRRLYEAIRACEAKREEA